MSSAKPKMGPRIAQSASQQQSGAYKIDSVRDAAESIGISNLPDAVASTLASDVEYRIHQVLEEAARFMRHGRRTMLTTSDIDQALRVLNIEPLYGHTPYNPPTFRRAPPLSSSGIGGSQSVPTMPGGSGATAGAASGGAGGSIPNSVYFVEDEEIDFDRVIRDEKIVLPRSVNWTAHWLAVEGVQPLIPENPPAIQRETAEDVAGVNGKKGLLNGVVANATTTTAQGMAAPVSQQKQQQQQQQQTQQQQQLVKQVLSRELQLYYSRLTSSLLPSSSPSTAGTTTNAGATAAAAAATTQADPAKRTAALASLRQDAGLQALLPYLIRWVGEGVVGVLKEQPSSEKESEGRGERMQVLLDVIGALLENKTLFVEPYLHQLLPPLLSLLLHSTLPPSHSVHLRTSASQTLSSLLRQHSTTYPSLSPRIMKTLLLALVAPGKTAGTREGAVRGLVGVGKEAIRKGLVEGGGARVIGAECASGSATMAWKDKEGLVRCVMDAFRTLYPPSDMPESLDTQGTVLQEDKEFWEHMLGLLGPEFAERLAVDRDWARGVVWGEGGKAR